jgi:small subunit ribosomal protein S19
MGRSLKKGPYVDEKLFRKVEKMAQQRKKDPIKTWARRCTIVPEFVGFTFNVHNGKQFLPVMVTEDMASSASAAPSAVTRTRRKASTTARSDRADAGTCPVSRLTKQAHRAPIVDEAGGPTRKKP